MTMLERPPLWRCDPGAVCWHFRRDRTGNIRPTETVVSSQAGSRGRETRLVESLARTPLQTVGGPLQTGNVDVSTGVFLWPAWVRSRRDYARMVLTIPKSLLQFALFCGALIKLADR